jgi:hypothetical protein
MKREWAFQVKPFQKAIPNVQIRSELMQKLPADSTGGNALR